MADELERLAEGSLLARRQASHGPVWSGSLLQSGLGVEEVPGQAPGAGLVVGAELDAMGAAKKSGSSARLPR
jgi:hypothetical protein